MSVHGKMAPPAPRGAGGAAASAAGKQEPPRPAAFWARPGQGSGVHGVSRLSNPACTKSHMLQNPDSCRCKSCSAACVAVLLLWLQSALAPGGSLGRPTRLGRCVLLAPPGAQHGSGLSPFLTFEEKTTLYASESQQQHLTR